MTQITINIENQAILPHLKKILSALDGVSIAKTPRKVKSSIDRSLEEARSGKTRKFTDVEDFFADLGI